MECGCRQVYMSTAMLTENFLASDYCVTSEKDTKCPVMHAWRSDVLYRERKKLCGSFIACFNG